MVSGIKRVTRHRVISMWTYFITPGEPRARQIDGGMYRVHVHSVLVFLRALKSGPAGINEECNAEISNACERPFSVKSVGNWRYDIANE